MENENSYLFFYSLLKNTQLVLNFCCEQVTICLLDYLYKMNCQLFILFGARFEKYVFLFIRNYFTCQKKNDNILYKL